MKKKLLLTIALILALVMTGCGARKIDLEHLHSIDGTLLEITRTPQEAMTLEEFEASIYTISVSYSGLAFIPNPVFKDGMMMSDEDFKKVYNFCLDAYEKDRFAKYSEDVCDGDTYSFVYYDEAGESHVLYSGYCYNNKELNEIIKTIELYSVD